MNKKTLKRIEAKLDLLLTELGHGDKLEKLNRSIPGGGLPKPKDPPEEDDPIGG